MRLIWIKSDYIDPPDTGGKLRTFNLMRELHKRCNVDYISLCSDREENKSKETTWASQVITFFRPEERKEGTIFYLRLIKRLFSLRPYIVQKYTSQEVLSAQEQLLSSRPETLQGSSDQTVLICDFLEMAGNVLWSAPWPKILFQHNIESVIWRRYVDNERNWLKRTYFWFEAQRLARYERQACDRFDMVLAVSERDRDTMREMGVTTPIEVIDTGVDLDFFAKPMTSTSVPGRLLFLGSLDWMPNIDGLKWFVDDIYPRIKQRCPNVSLDIVGRRPIAAISRLQDDDQSIRVFGDVPDVRDYIAACDLFVVPLRVGSGTRLKIFEAMAMQRPVISTTIGAEGLPLTPGKHLLVGDAPDQFAVQVAALLNDSDKKDMLASNGHQLVEDTYSWNSVSQRLFEICAKLSREPQ